MDNQDIQNLKGKRVLAREIATRATDPNFFAALEWLPNPDRILRKLGKSQEVYEDIMGDAHVIGELRSIRSALLGFEWRVMPGGDSPNDMRAFELCSNVMEQQPAPNMQWSDVIWTMGCAVFKGYSVHEVVWERQDRLLIPAKVVDRPQRRFLFGLDNQLRLKTQEHVMDGVELGNFKWLLTRHMATYENPYGVAVFSNCFWPYTFKHSGYKFFVKFCEKYGIPWAIVKYPLGTPKEDQDKLTDALAQMIEDAVGAIPNDGSVELIEHKHSGQPVQERLINISNREMSKALTSQTLSTEILDTGARAASETHRERETTVNQSDRSIIEFSFNELFKWITHLNIADANPPRFEFYEEAEARKEMVESLQGARKLVPLSKREVYDRLQLSEPEDEQDTIPVTQATPKSLTLPPEFTRPCPNCGGYHFNRRDDDVFPLERQASDFADPIIEDLVDPIRELLDKSSDLHEFQRGLTELFPSLDETRLGELMQAAMLTSWLQGMDEADQQ